MQLHRHPARGSFLVRLVLSIILLFQSSVALASPSSTRFPGSPWPVPAAPTATTSKAAYSPTDNGWSPGAPANPSGACQPDRCEVFLPLVIAGGGAHLPPPAVDTEPPTAPTNLRATATTTTSISLAWDTATDNV